MSYCCCTPQIYCRYCQKTEKPFGAVKPFFKLSDKDNEKFMRDSTHPPVPTAQPKQEPNKDGSPCPEFWDWLPKAYNFEGDGNFTKYNMEVAFLAGKQAAQPKEPEQRSVSEHLEPVVWMYQDKSTHEVRFQKHMRDFVDHGATYETPLYTTPPQRTWVGLNWDDLPEIYVGDTAFLHGAKWAEAKLREKNSL